MSLKATYNKDFFIKNNCIHLSNDFLSKNFNRFKKITGSKIGAILNKNKYTSPLKVWMLMVNLYQEMMDETLAYVGNTIEPKLRKYIENKLQINYKEYNPFQVKWDVFKENKIFGGLPDGEPIDNDGNFLYSKNYPMLEIKTTSIDSFLYKTENGGLVMQKDANNIPIVKKEKGKMEGWFDANNNLIIPYDYQLQLCLYMYLRKVKYGIFVVGFLEKQDYANPAKFDVAKRRIETAKIDLSLIEFENIVETATNWYYKYIHTGISPEISESDWKWLKPLLDN
ncbi:MAG: YqaJ viral recombinase family protein [Malacoplasma sp.]|mgnify:CR=1 FL=1|nr:YqaJ viral recombinase family protein [Malacoplasma sp.]